MTTLRAWAKENLNALQPKNPIGTVVLFCDEYSNYNEANIGEKAIRLLTRLGYKVEIVDHLESGRTFLSKGLVKKAQTIAQANVSIFKKIIGPNKPLIGIEPSAIQGFRDEYPNLVEKSEQGAALTLSKNWFLIDEFIANENVDAGRISATSFTTENKKVKLHGHCHQKALSSVNYSQKILSAPANYKVEVIPSGCCGMAGSFGYEEEHFDISMKVGELILFPAVRKSTEDTIIAAPGTSCRHQIKDGTGRIAKHTLEVLYEALV